MSKKTKTIIVTIDGNAVCDAISKKEIEELPVSIRVENKLIELLENVDKETATPEILEASARIAEVLFGRY